MSRSTRSTRSNTLRARPSAALVVASLSLVVAMGGTGYASGLITGKQVKNGSISGKDLKDSSVAGRDLADGTVTSADVAGLTKTDIAPDSLDGDVIDELHLETVGSAYDAKNAHQLDGLTNDEFLQTDSCQQGKVLGFARVKGNAGTIPSSYTTSTTYVDSTNNCSHSSVAVRRTNTGQYHVKFTGNPAFLAFAQVRTEGDVLDSDVCATLRKETADGPDEGAFEVVLMECDGSSFQDADFTLLLP